MNKEYIFFASFLLLGIILGWAIANIYQINSIQSNKYDGLWIPYNYSHPKILETAKTYDTKGSWICINIKGMSIERMIETCQHEAGHEIFAEKCEKNITKCLEIDK